MTKAEIISELEELKAQFEQRVIDRVDLILKAQKVAGILDYRAGDTDTDIRAKAVAHARGAESTPRA